MPKLPENDNQSSELKPIPSYYSVTTAKVRYDKSLPPAAKLLYGELTALSNKWGYCTANNQYFADLYSVSTDTVSLWISKLVKGGHIRVEIDRAAGNKRKIYITEPLPYPNKPTITDVQIE